MTAREFLTDGRIARAIARMERTRTYQVANVVIPMGTAVYLTVNGHYFFPAFYAGVIALNIIAELRRRDGQAAERILARMRDAEARFERAIAVHQATCARCKNSESGACPDVIIARSHDDSWEV